MNILVITGSPRTDGNSELLADAFIEGARERFHQVDKFRAGRKNISGCNACERCWSKGKPCVIDDDLDELTPLLENADVVVFVSPLYYFGVTAQIKAVIDRMYAYISKDRRTSLKIKGSVLIMCGGTDDKEDFEGAVATYKKTAHHMRWRDSGGLIVPSVNDRGDVEGTDALVAAKELGKSM